MTNTRKTKFILTHGSGLQAAMMRPLRWKGLGRASHTACGTEAETGRQMGTGPQPTFSILYSLGFLCPGNGPALN